MSSTTDIEELEFDIDPFAIPSSSTETEFIDWSLKQEFTRAEWVNGDVVAMSPASARHVDIIHWLIKVLGVFVEYHQLGSLKGPDFTVRLKTATGIARRVPDVLFVDRTRVALIKKNHLEGAPDLAIEVVSPESEIRDRQLKHAEYESAGVREYWIIDPNAEKLDVFTLNSAGKYQQIEPADGKLASSVIAGFWLRPEWMWQVPLPFSFRVYQELGIMP